MLAVCGEGAWQVDTAVLPITVNGTGDATAAIFLARYLKHGNPASALSGTASAIYAVLEATHRARAREIQLVSAQESLVNSPRWFKARRLR